MNLISHFVCCLHAVFYHQPHRVLDVNDHAPSISLNTLTNIGTDRAEILENADRETFVAFVRVSDEDSGPNGRFNCSLSDQNFRSVTDPNYFYLLSNHEIVLSFWERRIQEGVGGGGGRRFRPSFSKTKLPKQHQNFQNMSLWHSTRLVSQFDALDFGCKAPTYFLSRLKIID